jgi:hypothetical protein
MKRKFREQKRLDDIYTVRCVWISFFIQWTNFKQ